MLDSNKCEHTGGNYRKRKHLECFEESLLYRKNLNGFEDFRTENGSLQGQNSALRLAFVFQDCSTAADVVEHVPHKLAPQKSQKILKRLRTFSQRRPFGKLLV
jgi:hypothetical protein